VPEFLEAAWGQSPRAEPKAEDSDERILPNHYRIC